MTNNPIRIHLAQVLHFSYQSERQDILNEQGGADTYLIAALQDLVLRCKHPILVTALRSNHPTYDGGLTGHGHNAGKAADIWHEDWTRVGDEGIVDVAKALIPNPYIWTVGLGGSAWNYCKNLPWPTDPRFILFQDNASDHIHIQVGNAYGQGERISS